MSAAINYLKGDATSPQAAGNKIIAHICNDRGAWGKGFVLAVTKRWKQPEVEFRRWYAEHAANNFKLGEVQLVQAAADIWVANMIGQHGIYANRDGPPIRYNAVYTCLLKLVIETTRLNASVHMPRIGCGLAGGTWDKIEPLIGTTLCAAGVAVFVYDFESGSNI